MQEKLYTCVYMDVTWQNVAAVSVYPPLMIVSYVGTVSISLVFSFYQLHPCIDCPLQASCKQTRTKNTDKNRK